MTTSALSSSRHELFARSALPAWAIAAAVCGLLAAIPALPSVGRGVLLAVFVFVAPGAAILSWARTLPSNTVAALVPVTGLAVVLLVTGTASLLGAWQPRVTLIVLAVLAIGIALWAKTKRPAPRHAGAAS
ncbi:MAG: hypothetical protein ACRDV3_15375 [Acidothermaceae bacterium]